MDGLEFFPGAMKVLTEDQAAWNQDLSGTGLLESATDNGFAACFENAGTEEECARC